MFILLNIPITLSVWIVHYIVVFRPHFNSNYYRFKTDIYPKKCRDKKEDNWLGTIILILLIPVGILCLLLILIFVFLTVISLPAYIISVNLPFYNEVKRNVFQCAKCRKKLKEIDTLDEAFCPEGGRSEELVKAFKESDYTILEKIYPPLHRKRKNFVIELVVTVVLAMACFLLIVTN